MVWQTCPFWILNATWKFAYENRFEFLLGVFPVISMLFSALYFLLLHFLLLSQCYFSICLSLFLTFVSFNSFFHTLSVACLFLHFYVSLYLSLSLLLSLSLSSLLLYLYLSSLYLCLHLLSLSLSVSLFRFVFLSVCLPRLFILFYFLFVCFLFNISACLFFPLCLYCLCLSLPCCLVFCLSVYLSVCLSVYLFALTSQIIIKVSQLLLYIFPSCLC